MNSDYYSAKARSYLKSLCGVKPNRRTGSSGNREATDFYAETISSYGFDIDAAPFECLDHIRGESHLIHGNRAFEILISPYSNACDVNAELVAVSTVEELEKAHFTDKILLMRGAICADQLMPKNFVFYNPEHHRRIISLLESRRPAGIVTATARNPEQVGALYPHPLFVDGDFDIPSVYCKDTVGVELACFNGRAFQLKIDAKRIPSRAANVIARLNQTAPKKIVITAHIDAYEDSPGAVDNASGTSVLLLLAEMLSDYRENLCVEIAAFNGEDHYSVGGQMDYLARYGSETGIIMLAVNIDGIGCNEGRTAYSFYECSQQLQVRTEEVFSRFDGLVHGEQWFSGDHMIFVQKRVPSIAFTSERMHELMKTVIHTSSDTPDIIDLDSLVEAAESLNRLVRSL